MKKITFLFSLIFISSLSFAQTNLLANPDFDTDISGWTTQLGFSGADNSFAFSTENQGTSGAAGSGSLEMTVNTVSNPVNDGASSIRQELDLSSLINGPTTFSGSIWVSSNAPTPGGNGTDDTFKIQVFTENGGFQGAAFPQQDIPADGEFHEVVFTFDIDLANLDPNFDPTDVRVLFSFADSVGTFRFDNAILIQGDTSQLSTEEFSRTQGSIFPNPASSTLNINANISNEKASVYDLSGKLLFTKAVSGSLNSIDVSQLTAGMYFLRLENGSSFKFIKE
ncbi:T9SS type A sorting domain-containing protein [uncultured Winogradskyella sp.]|uniref:T9SS type A sorting domain-containing protein n=1 Tax=uncultured Winogradskyella sp. TaxID=395353 RepID=UPI0026122481|nr:T9SS type A sorting domain-containing protein [uncultured Winogradskyella sp.]